MTACSAQFLTGTVINELKPQLGLIMHRRLKFNLLMTFALAVSGAAAPVQAEVLKFKAELNGKYGSEPTGSAATGKACIWVDTSTRRVTVDLGVNGITIDHLWKKLVSAPVGPVHFHKYASAAGGDSVLALPLPFGADYRGRPGGLHVMMKDYDYVAGAALLQSSLTFDDFVAGMNNGLIVLNVHTDKFNAGEISGVVVRDEVVDSTCSP